MDIIFDIIKIFSNDFTVSEIITWIAVLISSIVGLLVYVKKELKEESKNIIANHLTSQDTIKKYLIELSKKSSKKNSLYKENLKQTLFILDNFFGKINFFSFKALKKHIYIAYVYTILFFIISWFFGGTGKLANNIYLPDIENIQIRINIFLSFLAVLSSMILIRGYGIDEKIYNHFLQKILQTYELIFFGSIYFVLTIFEYIFMNFILFSKKSWKELRKKNEYISIFSKDNYNGYNDGVIMSLLFPSFFVGIIFFLLLNNVYSCNPDYKVGMFLLIFVLIIFIFILIMLVFLILSLDEIISLTGVSVIFILLSILVLTFTLSGKSGIIGIVLFFILLPFINAIFDHISLYFSRLFAENIYKTTSKMKIFIDLFFDVLIAIVLFILFANILYHTINFVNTYFIKDTFYKIPINMYWNQISKNPFDKEVLWITLMFISTLVPTFLHILLGIYSILENFITKPHINILIQQIEKMTPKKEIREKENLAKELAKYNLSNDLKLYLILSSILVITIVFLMLLLSIKKGFYNV